MEQTESDWAAPLGDPEHGEQAARQMLPELRARGDWDKVATALEALVMAVRERPEEPRVLIELAEVRLCYLRRINEALLALERAVDLAPGDEALVALLRDAAEREGVLEDFRAVAQEVLEDAPPQAVEGLRRQLELAR